MFHIPAHNSVESLQDGHIYTVELGKRDQKNKRKSLQLLYGKMTTNNKLRENI